MNIFSKILWDKIRLSYKYYDFKKKKQEVVILAEIGKAKDKIKFAIKMFNKKDRWPEEIVKVRHRLFHYLSTMPNEVEFNRSDPDNTEDFSRLEERWNKKRVSLNFS